MKKQRFKLLFISLLVILLAGCPSGSEVNPGDSFTSSDGLLYFNVSEDGSYLTVSANNDDSFPEEYTIPASYNGIPVKAVGNFSYITSLKKVIIPEGIISIGWLAFSDCTNLEEIELPSSLQTIGAEAFANTSIKEIELSENISNVGTRAFSGCSSLEKVIVPFPVDKLTYWDTGWDYDIKEKKVYKGGINDVSYLISSDRTYYICYGIPTGSTLTEVVVESMHNGLPVKGIGYQAFTGSNIEKITLSDNLEYIDEWAFNVCSNLKEITLPASVETIYDNVFYVSGLEKIYIPENSRLAYIGMEAFAATSLTEFYIPSNVEYIGRNVFRDCTALESVYVDAVASYPRTWDSSWNYDLEGEGIVKMDPDPDKTYIFLNSDGKSYYVDGLSSESTITNIEIPNTYNGLPVTEIGNNAFNGCKSLESVTLGENIEIIGWNTFVDCISLSNIIIPNSVKQIGFNAFENTAIKEIEIPSSIEEVGAAVFYNCPKLTDVYLPFKEGETPAGWSSIWNRGLSDNVTIHYSDSGDPEDPDNPGTDPGDPDEGELRFIIDTYGLALDALVGDIQLGNIPDGVTTDPSNILGANEYTITMNNVSYSFGSNNFVFNGTYEYKQEYSMTEGSSTKIVDLTEGSSIDGVPHTAKWTQTTSFGGGGSSDSITDAVVDGVELEDQITEM